MIQTVKARAFTITVLTMAVLVAVGIYLSFIAPKQLEMGLSVDHAYTSVDEMKKAADLIVEGTALSQKTVDYEGVLFTTSVLQVDQVLKGKLKEKEIAVLETGGFDGKNHLTMEENRVMDPSRRYILFLEKYKGPVAKDAYVITGAYQGKFAVDGQRVEAPKQVNPKIETIDSKQALIQHISR